MEMRLFNENFCQSSWQVSYARAQPGKQWHLMDNLRVNTVRSKMIKGGEKFN